MSQYEIAMKYGVPQCDVSIAIKHIGHIKPIGEKKNPVTGYMIKTYDELAVTRALIMLYLKRSNKHLVKAEGWTDKANAIMEAIKNDRKTV